MLLEYDRGSIDGMKISVSLPDEDIRWLDEQVLDRHHESRSAAVHQAIVRLRERDRVEEYRRAWQDSADDDEALWDVTVSDGIG
jgi:Arc/MetJ-type ribon-helix-helix transcriptional regulator